MEIIETFRFQPDIVLGGLRIGEPVIALTSLFVAAVCFLGWWRLRNAALGPQDAVQLGRIFLLLTGISTLVGGLVGHAFLYQFSFEYKLAGWIPGILAVSAIEQASIVRFRRVAGADWGRFLSWVNIAEVTLALCAICVTLWFPIVEIHSAFGFLCLVLPMEAVLFFKYRQKNSRYLLWAIGLLVAAVLMHVFKISLDRWFCFFDLAHLFMAAAMWNIMRAFERGASDEVRGDE